MVIGVSGTKSERLAENIMNSVIHYYQSYHIAKEKI